MSITRERERERTTQSHAHTQNAWASIAFNPEKFLALSLFFVSRTHNLPRPTGNAYFGTSRGAYVVFRSHGARHGQTLRPLFLWWSHRETQLRTYLPLWYLLHDLYVRRELSPSFPSFIRGKKAFHACVSEFVSSTYVQ